MGIKSTELNVKWASARDFCMYHTSECLGKFACIHKLARAFAFCIHVVWIWMRLRPKCRPFDWLYTSTWTFITSILFLSQMSSCSSKNQYVYMATAFQNQLYNVCVQRRHNSLDIHTGRKKKQEGQDKS